MEWRTRLGDNPMDFTRIWCGALVTPPAMCIYAPRSPVPIAKKIMHMACRTMKVWRWPTAVPVWKHRINISCIRYIVAQSSNVSRFKNDPSGNYSMADPSWLQEQAYFAGIRTNFLRSFYWVYGCWICLSRRGGADGLTAFVVPS